MFLISEETKLRFYILNEGSLVKEETFSIQQLKDYYQKQWKMSKGDYQRFVNECLAAWSTKFEGWNVGTFDIV